MGGTTLVPGAPSARATRDVQQLLTEQGARHGRRPFLEAARGTETVSFSGMADMAQAWSAHLDRCDVPPGALVALILRDPLTFAVAFAGVVSSGRWVMPLDPTAAVLDPVATLAPARAAGAMSVVCDADVPHGPALQRIPPPPDLASALPSSDVRDLSGADQAGRDGEGGVVLSSSGTTGTPKVVRLAQGQLLFAAHNIARHHGLSPDDRGLNPLPLFHINAEVVGLLASLVAGATLVLDDQFHRTGFWDVVVSKEITWVNAVPAIVTLLADMRDGERPPPSMRFIRSASAPLPADTMRAFETATGIAVVESYGMTEAASQITANPIGGPRKPGSVGIAVGVAIRIDAPEGAEEGPVQIKGPSVITHYEGGRHADRFTADGWLRTGDIGRIDEDGYLYLLGREDDVINRGGEKVFPREIEEALLADRDVAAAVVVPRADAVLGQVPVAYVVLEDTSALDDGSMVDELAGRLQRRLMTTLVRAKRPAEIRVVASLPTGPTGKILRRAVRELSVPTVLRLDTR